MLNEYYPKASCDRVYIHGDFSAAVEKAKQYAKNNDIGAYNLFTNNCAHYVHTLLKAGTADDPDLERMLENSSVLIPSSLSLKIYHCTYKFSSVSPNVVIVPTVSTIGLILLIIWGLSSK